MAILTYTSALHALRTAQAELRINYGHSKSGGNVYFKSMDVQRQYDKLEQLVVLFDILEETGFNRVQQMARQRLIELNSIQQLAFPEP